VSHARDAAYTIDSSASAGFGCSRNMNAASVKKRAAQKLISGFRCVMTDSRKGEGKDEIR
jgi:hypothetical protein